MLSEGSNATSESSNPTSAKSLLIYNTANDKAVPSQATSQLRSENFFEIDIMKQNKRTLSMVMNMRDQTGIQNVAFASSDNLCRYDAQSGQTFDTLLTPLLVQPSPVTTDIHYAASVEVHNGCVQLQTSVTNHLDSLEAAGFGNNARQLLDLQLNRRKYYTKNSITSQSIPATSESKEKIGRTVTSSHRCFWILTICALFALSTAQDVDLSSNLVATGKGFRIVGAAAGDVSGQSVSAAGDVNNDGIGDIIIGAPDADPLGRTDAGITYVIFGRSVSKGATPFEDIQLTTGVTAMPDTVGFRILGSADFDYSGKVVSAAGDVNGDGVGDIITVARYASPVGNTGAGIIYVVFGRDIPGGAAPFGDIQLTTGATAMPDSVGFRILGIAASGQTSYSVSEAGDINNDGISDVIVGAPQADHILGLDAGISYVIFGRNMSSENALPFGDIQLTTGFTSLESEVGFRILGAAAEDQSGCSVSAAGDVNNDGISDIIIGAFQADSPGGINAGVSYVIFGRNIDGNDLPFTDIQLTTTALSPDVGFRILGAVDSDASGVSVGAAGDINGDGIGDVIVGAYLAASTGISYVIFGGAAFGDIQLTTTIMPASVGFRILGAAISDMIGYSVSAAGDVNNDGVDDIVVGAYAASPVNGAAAGISYVIYGRKIPGGAMSFPDIQLTTGTTEMSPIVGFRILGAVATDMSGYYVSAAGDMNGDGVDDVIVGALQAHSNAGVSYVVYGVDLLPTSLPSSQPSAQPTTQPTKQPSRQPTSQPSNQPSNQPSGQPCGQPSGQPSAQPSSVPTTQPSRKPSSQPSRQPSIQPSTRPSTQPSTQPSGQPSMQPLTQPSTQPSILPSAQPSAQPSMQPSSQPSVQPSTKPSMQPSTQPSTQPNTQPSTQPSAQPSAQPSMQPSSQPSVQPSAQPSVQPSAQPSVQSSTQRRVQFCTVSIWMLSLVRVDRSFTVGDRQQERYPYETNEFEAHTNTVHSGFKVKQISCVLGAPLCSRKGLFLV